MISGYIDLSVGSAMSLSAVVFAWMILNGFSFLPAFVITLILGIVMGCLNGFLVMKLRITPVIATLVTLNLFKGIALLIVPDGAVGHQEQRRRRPCPPGSTITRARMSCSGCRGRSSSRCS